MRYTFFEIESFKGIISLRIDFQKTPESRIYTLVGLNESGKTTVLEAINSFAYGTERLDLLELPGYGIRDIHDLIPISKRPNFNGNIVIKVGLKMDAEDTEQLKQHLEQECEYRIKDAREEFTVSQISSFKDSRYQPKESKKLWAFKLNGRRVPRKTVPNHEQKDEWQTAVTFLSGLMPRIWYFPNFLFEFPERIYLEERIGASTNEVERDRFYRGLLQDILDALANDTNLETHIIQRAKSGDPNDKESLEGLLLEMSRNVTSSVFDAWNEMLGRKVMGKEVVLEVKNDEQERYYSRFRIKDADGYFSISERSLGFRWFFVYLLLTLYRASRKRAPTNMLLLLDEPASNLHPTAQARLLRSFEKLAQRCMVIYTTHSHHLINPAWLESTYVVKNAGLEYEHEDDFNANKTDISAVRYREFAAKHPSQSSYFQPILEVLDYQPSALENVPRIAMLEGKNDFYTLNYVQRCLLSRQTVIPLFPGGGASSLKDIIGLYIAWGREFIVMLDSDAEGRKQKVSYIKQFGGLVRDRIFVLSDVDENWKSLRMEGIFSESERLTIQRTAYPNLKVFRKDCFNRAIQEAFLRSQIIQISEKTKESFSAVLDFIEHRLMRSGN